MYKDYQKTRNRCVRVIKKPTKKKEEKLSNYNPTRFRDRNLEK